MAHRIGHPRLGLLRRTLDLLARLVAVEVRDSGGGGRGRPRTPTRAAEPDPPRIGAIRLARPERDLPDTHSRGRVQLGAARGLDTFDAALDAAMRRRFGGAAAPEVIDAGKRARQMFRTVAWELRIPGRHYGGLTNQQMLEVRTREGRPFAADTRALREHAIAAVARAMDGRAWDDDEAAVAFADAVLAWIVKRVEAQGPDVQLKPLSPAWRAEKRRRGLDPRIGVATGAWLRALKRAEVRVR